MLINQEVFFIIQTASKSDLSWIVLLSFLSRPSVVWKCARCSKVTRWDLTSVTSGLVRFRSPDLSIVFLFCFLFVFFRAGIGYPFNRSWMKIIHLFIFGCGEMGMNVYIIISTIHEIRSDCHGKRITVLNNLLELSHSGANVNNDLQPFMIIWWN